MKLPCEFVCSCPFVDHTISAQAALTHMHRVQAPIVLLVKDDKLVGAFDRHDVVAWAAKAVPLPERALDLQASERIDVVLSGSRLTEIEDAFTRVSASLGRVPQVLPVVAGKDDMRPLGCLVRENFFQLLGNLRWQTRPRRWVSTICYQ